MPYWFLVKCPISKPTVNKIKGFQAHDSNGCSHVLHPHEGGVWAPMKTRGPCAWTWSHSLHPSGLLVSLQASDKQSSAFRESLYIKTLQWSVQTVHQGILLTRRWAQIKCTMSGAATSSPIGLSPFILRRWTLPAWTHVIGSQYNDTMGSFQQQT